MGKARGNGEAEPDPVRDCRCGRVEGVGLFRYSFSRLLDTDVGDGALRWPPLVTFQQHHDCITTGVQDRTGFGHLFIHFFPELEPRSQQARSSSGDVASYRRHPERSPVFVFPF